MSNEMSMHGRTVVITGATGGIGLAAARELARLGARVVGVSRSAEKCARTAEQLRTETGNPDIGIYCADLSSLDQVREVAGEILASQPKIDVLINNAGAIFLWRGQTIDGYESTFALNHLSGYLLTRLLLDRITASAPARIVNVSSNAHYDTRLPFDDVQNPRTYHPMQAYGQSKLANVLFTYELDRRLKGTGVTANAMHPGLVRTNIAADNGLIVRLFQRLILIGARSPERGARTIVYLAASPEVEGVSGKFFIDEKPVASSEVSYRTEDAARLWSMSEELTGLVQG